MKRVMIAVTPETRDSMKRLAQKSETFERFMIRLMRERYGPNWDRIDPTEPITG